MEDASEKPSSWSITVRQILCVRLKNWPIDRWKRKNAGSEHEPIALVRTVASRQVLVAVNDAATARSITAGMTLAEARAICAEVRHIEHDPYRDAVALEALARWMM